MKLFTLLIALVIITSCSTQRCYPSKKSRDYADAQIKEGIITKNHEKTVLVSIRRTARGFKHVFVTEQKDTMVRYYNCPLTVGDCYYVLKDFHG